ncbi:hypothetical protein PMIN01_04326 [Paraphaeosphaeria minitans]|uniref:GST N-terminal domain-containing protein n=1 Tax=Paraphaeosphaeria minitans TaxID=565426 RepID=A0A9P6GIV5_9PLEO|nr:hypothetical protein PMIN01_04326 [Paraphaeosphaeria minitans]
MPSLTLYDISSPLIPRSYAPNPSKARLALGFKQATFRTEWVDIPDIERVRRSLDCAATRKLDDGSDFFTLPMLQDADTGRVVGDSFDIAIHLDSTFPLRPPLLPPPHSLKGRWRTYESPARDTLFFAPVTTNAESAHPALARFNLHVDTTFSANMALYGQFLPLHPETAEGTKALMCRRAHLESWDDLAIPEEARRPLFEGAFKEAMGGLAELYGGREGEGGNGGRGGIWLEGEEPCYADLIVGGWLNMLSCLMPEEEWREFRGWFGGIFGRVHDQLQERFYVC